MDAAIEPASEGISFVESFEDSCNHKLGHLEKVMKKAVSVTLFVCASTWCTSGLGEEKKLDPGVVNDWMRATVSSETDETELKRIVYIETMGDWTKSQTSFHVKYEVTNSTCKRTLSFNITNELGSSKYAYWLERIEESQDSDSKQYDEPRVLVRTYNYGEAISKVQDLNVEYRIQDGKPLLVVSDQQEVERILRAFNSGTSARIRIIAFDNVSTFTLNLRGFSEKESWFHENCPLDPTDTSGKNEVPAS